MRHGITVPHSLRPALLIVHCLGWQLFIYYTITQWVFTIGKIAERVI